MYSLKQTAFAQHKCLPPKLLTLSPTPSPEKSSHHGNDATVLSIAIPGAPLLDTMWTTLS